MVQCLCTPVIKYSDDSAMEDLSNSDTVYFAEVEMFSNWCRDLDLNVKKTKEKVFEERPFEVLEAKRDENKSL